MSRQMMRVVVVGGALASTVAFGGVAFAYPATSGNGNGGGVSTPGGTNGSGNGSGTAGNGSGGTTTTTFTSTSSNGGGVSGTSGSGGTSSLPFTGFELATALTLGVGAIGAGGVVVLASRKRRDTSAVA